MKGEIFHPVIFIIVMLTTVLNALKLMFLYIVISTISEYVHI